MNKEYEDIFNNRLMELEKEKTSLVVDIDTYENTGGKGIELMSEYHNTMIKYWMLCERISELNRLRYLIERDY